MKKEQERKRERGREGGREEIPAEVARTEEAREGGVLLEEVGSCLLSRVVSHLIFA
jgi:hypothetical protein